MTALSLSEPLRRVDWLVSSQAVGYLEAVAAMEARVAAVADGRAPELVWLLEHPPIYTAGTSAQTADLVEPDRFPVFTTGRGGQYTYHGPGQRIAYVMLDLKARGGDVRAFVARLEAWMISALAVLGVSAGVRPGRVGVWVDRGGDGSGERRDDKIAALGIRVRRGVTYHGLALNVAPDLSHFAGIVPCGIRDHGITSLADLGAATSMQTVDKALRATFERHVSITRDVG